MGHNDRPPLRGFRKAEPRRTRRARSRISSSPKATIGAASLLPSPQLPERTEESNEIIYFVPFVVRKRVKSKRAAPPNPPSDFERNRLGRLTLVRVAESRHLAGARE
jgi:hypothetical protein